MLKFLEDSESTKVGVESWRKRRSLQPVKQDGMFSWLCQTFRAEVKYQCDRQDLVASKKDMQRAAPEDSERKIYEEWKELEQQRVSHFGSSLLGSRRLSSVAIWVFVDFRERPEYCHPAPQCHREPPVCKRSSLAAGWETCVPNDESWRPVSETSESCYADVELRKRWISPLHQKVVETSQAATAGKHCELRAAGSEAGQARTCGGCAKHLEIWPITALSAVGLLRAEADHRQSTKLREGEQVPFQVWERFCRLLGTGAAGICRRDFLRALLGEWLWSVCQTWQPHPPSVAWQRFRSFRSC